MNVPDPFQLPPASDPRTARIAAVATLAGGTPLAIVGVMLWEAASGQTLDSVRACAVGSIAAGVFGYLWHVVTTVIDRHLNL